MSILVILLKAAYSARMTVRINDTATIFALATAPLAAGVAIIRISGAEAWQAAATLNASFTQAKPRSAHYGTLVNSVGEALDKALLLGFKAPSSFTGEDVVEIHCHGGMAVIRSILDELGKQLNLRPATAGEFTRRAFQNGKLDLVEAEGLADLIAAETTAQHRQALQQLQGEVGNTFEHWREELITILAQVEAGIDFPDEELDVLSEYRVKERLTVLNDTFTQALRNNMGERIRNGFSLAIIGAPNTGKSTLTNLLTGQETAIVSPIAGTTRDVVTAHLTIGGYPVIIADTAGMRLTDDTIEAEGVKRAQLKAEQADIIIAMCHAADWPNIADEVKNRLQPTRSIIVISHADEHAIPLPELSDVSGGTYPTLALNLCDTNSLDTLLPALETCIVHQFGGREEANLITRQRHRTAIEHAQNYIQQALTIIDTPHEGSIAELIAQDVRDAVSHIGNITGRTGTEDVLDKVFSTFCIGK